MLASFLQIQMTFYKHITIQSESVTSCAVCPRWTSRAHGQGGKKLPTPIIVTFAAIWTIVLEKGWADCSLLFRRFRWQKGTGVLETHSTVHLSLNVTLREPQGITHKYEPGVRIYAIIRQARYWGQPQNEFTPVPCSPTVHPHTQHVFIINSLSKY